MGDVDVLITLVISKLVLDFIVFFQSKESFLIYIVIIIIIYVYAYLYIHIYI